MGRVISTKGDYTLVSPHNSQDMNYHLVNTKEGKDHLIDICDVYDDKNKADEYGLWWEELKSLEHIDAILEYSWKTISG